MARDRDENEFEGQYLPADIQKMQIIEIGKINRQPPSVGIFDEPTRCFRVNQEWWSIIAGMVDWLADVAAWPDAQDEKYSAILEIQRFMQGVDCVDCEEIASCIQSSSSVHSSLAQYFSTEAGSGTGGGFGGGVNAPINGRDTDELINTSEDCDLDDLFGSITQLIQYMDRVIRDVLQKVELATDSIEATGILLEAVPIFGQFAASSANGINWLLETASEAYLAGYTTTLEDKIRCDLFCLAQDNCTLTVNQLATYFAANAGNEWTTIDIQDLLLDYVGLADEEAIVYALLAVLTGVMSIGASWGGASGIRTLQLQMALGLNHPDSDWTLLCEECNEWCYEWDFTIDDQSWQQWATDNRPFGQYLAGQGWGMTFGNIGGAGNGNGCYIELIAGSDFDFTRQEVDYVGTAGAANRNLGISGENNDAFVYSNNFGSYSTDGQEHTFAYDGTHTIDKPRVFVTAGLSSLDADACIIKRVRIYGNGPNPFGTTNC